jgi:predicted 2-oxoglutarate/Fe(II)-dependent dioxygenase YbiX
MKNRLKDYVLTVPHLLTNALCKKIIKELKSSNWKTHNFYFAREKVSRPISNGKDSDNTGDILPSTQLMKDAVWKAIHKYIIEEFNFPWFPGWEGFTPLKFNRYQKSQLMEEHCDHIHSMFEGKVRGIPILSVIGALNNNYEGGEFVMFKNIKYKIKAGEILIFPSIFLYPHKVMPVTKGTRYTYTTWVY